nr:hypothetical protein [Tanacetum cinerariifolium]
MGIHDFLCLPKWISAEVQEEPNLDFKPTLQRLPFYCTPPAAADAVIPDPTLEDLPVGTPSSKILIKAEVSQKRKDSTSGATSSYVAKRTSDDDDARVEILLVTPIRSAAVIPSSGTRVGALLLSLRPRPSFRPVPSFRDVSGDAIHMDFFHFSAGPYYATYPKDGVAGNYEFTREEWDALYRPTFVVLTKEVFKDLVVCKTMVD